MQFRSLIILAIIVVIIIIVANLLWPILGLLGGTLTIIVGGVAAFLLAVNGII
jgi:hypothetical protein